MKKILTTALLMAWAISGYAQDTLKTQVQDSSRVIGISADSVMFSDAYLDSLDIRKKSVINDYTLIGVQYGM